MIGVLENTAREENKNKKGADKMAAALKKTNVLVVKGAGSDKRGIVRTVVHTRRPPIKSKPVKQAIFNLENAKKAAATTAKTGANPTETKSPAPSSNLFTYSTTSDGETVGTRKSKQATKNAKEKERRKRKKAKLEHHDEDDV